MRKLISATAVATTTGALDATAGSAYAGSGIGDS